MLQTGGVSVNNEAQPARPVPERRAPSLSAEEMKQGIEFRKKALKSAETDLGSIARTAPALSSSPPQPVSVVTDAQVRVMVSRIDRVFSLLLTFNCH